MNVQHQIKPALLFAAFCASPLFAESPELTMMKEQIRQLEASGAQVPQSLYDLVKQMEQMDKKSSGGSSKAANLSCSQNIAGTWYSSGKDQKVVLGSSGRGNFVQHSVSGEFYRAEVPFTWRASGKTISFNYTADMTYTNLDSGKVTYKAKPAGGTVSCSFANSVLNIGGVPYYK